MLRNGIKLTATANQIKTLKKAIDGFKESDFSVKLGAVLDPETRRYYIKNRFSYLSNKLKQIKEQAH